MILRDAFLIADICDFNAIFVKTDSTWLINWLLYLQEQQTPLHIAARLGHVDNVSILLQHGASPDAVTKDLYTPLHIAAKEGHEDVAAVLLERSANPTLTTKV